MKKFRLAIAALSLAVTVSSCASISAPHIAYNCGNREGGPWTRIEAPASSELYLQRVRADRRPGAPPGGAEYWFSRPDGAVKYCLLREYRGACSAPGGSWWTFTQSENGPVTSGQESGICVL